MKQIILRAIVLLSFIFSIDAHAASFDCSKASTPQEKMVCADAGLSQLDTQLNQRYQQVLPFVPDSDAFIKSQLQWLKTRNQCQDSACLLQAYKPRLAALQLLQQQQQKALADNMALVNTNNPQHYPVIISDYPVTEKYGEVYPIWISSELGIRGISPQDINDALNRKFWNNPIYLKKYLQQVQYLKKHQEPDVPSDCQSLARLIAEKKYTPDGINRDDKDPINFLSNTSFLSNAQIACQTTRLLRKIKPATVSNVNKFMFNAKNLSDFMPFIIAPGAYACMIPQGLDASDLSDSFRYFQVEDLYKPWKDNNVLSPPSSLESDSFYKINPAGLHSVESSVFDSNTQLLAHGSFIQKNHEEMLVAYNTYIQDENDFSTALYLLQRSNPNQLLQLLFPNKYIINSDYNCDAQLSFLL